jgi:hypothetical protein
MPSTRIRGRPEEQPHVERQGRLDDRATVVLLPRVTVGALVRYEWALDDKAEQEVWRGQTADVPIQGRQEPLESGAVFLQVTRCHARREGRLGQTEVRHERDQQRDATDDERRPPAEVRTERRDQPQAKQRREEQPPEEEALIQHAHGAAVLATDVFVEQRRREKERCSTSNSAGWLSFTSSR